MLASPAGTRTDTSIPALEARLPGPATPPPTDKKCRPQMGLHCHPALDCPRCSYLPPNTIWGQTQYL